MNRTKISCLKSPNIYIHPSLRPEMRRKKWKEEKSLQLLLSPLPLHNTRSQWPGEQTRVVGANNVLAATYIPQLELAHECYEDGLQLKVSKLLTNATMPSSTKRQVGRVCSLGNNAPTIVDFFLVGIVALLVILLVLGVPSVRVPDSGVDKVSIELRRETGRGHQCMGGRHNIVCSVDNERLLDFAHD